MSKKFSAVAVTFVALALTACGAGSVGTGNTALMNGTTYSLPAVDPDLAMTATVPKDTIGEELPGEGVGSIKSSVWKATLGGFTQMQLAVARFPSRDEDYDPQPFLEHHAHTRRSQSDLRATRRLSAEPEAPDTAERQRQTRSRICERAD
jgi:hypothetical protein